MPPSGLAIIIGAGPNTVSRSYSTELLCSSLILSRMISTIQEHLIQTQNSHIPSGNRHSPHPLPPLPRKPSRRPPRPPSREPHQRPRKPKRDISRKYHRGLPHRHVTHAAQIRLPIHPHAQLLQEPQAQSSRLLRQALVQKALPERDVRGVHREPRAVRRRRLHVRAGSAQDVLRAPRRGPAVGDGREERDADFYWHAGRAEV